MIKTVKKSQNSNWFMDLLLDETICAGTVAVPREMVRLAGGVNKRLGAKQKYELLLRIAAETPVELEETDEDACGQENMMVFDDAEEPENTGLGWRTDCYVLGKYSAQLQEAGYFNAAIEAVLAEAQMEGRYEETVSYLEGMIGHKEEYYRIDEAAQPILIYKGDPVCYNILTIFAEQLGEALERRGERVLYFDQEEHDPREIIQFKGRHFKAVIGVQSCAFSIKMEDEVHYLHEYIYGPKYNFSWIIRSGESRTLNIITRIFMCWYWIRHMPISSGASTNRMRFFSAGGNGGGGGFRRADLRPVIHRHLWRV